MSLSAVNSQPEVRIFSSTVFLFLYIFILKTIFTFILLSLVDLAFQGYSKEFGKVNCLLELSGQDLIGLPIKAPLTSYDVIYVLPMLTISTEKVRGQMGAEHIVVM